MKKHLDMSERERHLCDEPSCSFQSVSKTSLRAHKRLEHLGQKRTYTCSCGKTFSQNSSYYTHVKIVHEKHKNHACNFCPKSFFDKGNLRNHIKSQHASLLTILCLSSLDLMQSFSAEAKGFAVRSLPENVCDS